jgi:short-subunit dehydrogenase
MEVAGRRVLITGASRGIGEAMARRFAARRARVALVARTEPAIKDLAAELDCTAHPADLSDPLEVRDLVERIEGDGGPIDVLVNNAGIEEAGRFDEQSADDVERAFQVNLLSPAELCRQAIPGMLRRGRGHIVNVSSLAGTGVFPGLVVYSSTKAGLTQLTAGLRAELRGTPVRTTLVELGPVPTDMLDRAEAYEPTRASFERFRQLHLLADVAPAEVADDVVAAVEGGRRHVRHPKRASAFPLLAEIPRRTVELLLTGVRNRPA